MKSKKWIAMLLALSMAGTIALTACGGGDDGSSTPGSSVESTGDVSASDSTGDSAGDSQEWSAPVITVTPAVVEMTSGDEVDVMFGVTVMDEYDTDLVATIADDEGFDGETEGTYVITYSATNSKGKTGTATRTIIVSAPKAKINVEVPYETTGKWDSTVLDFNNKDYHALTEDTSYNAAYSGIYHNVGTADIVVDIIGGGGIVAILNAYGECIEGRDGANGQLMNVDNPLRANGPSSYTVGSETYTVSQACARGMTIPVGGMAIVVFKDFYGTGYDNDGRGFINQNLVREYGLLASVYVNDGESAPFTTYRNQAPVVKAPAAVNIEQGAKTQDEVDVMVKAGLEIKDDGGTFAPSDDITTGWEVTITDRGGFDANTPGEYTYTCTVTDGTLTTEFTRLVKVVSNVATVTVDGATPKDFEKSRVLVNQKADDYNNYDLCIYTTAFDGTFKTNSYGAAMIIGTDGKIKAVYNGTNGEYLDATHLGEGNREGYGVTGIITVDNYLTKAFEDLQDGEILLVGANNSTQVGRAWILNFRRKSSDPITTWIGTSVTISGITIA